MIPYQRSRAFLAWAIALGLALAHSKGYATLVQSPAVEYSPEGVRITVHLGFTPAVSTLPPAALPVLDRVGRMLKDAVLSQRVFTIIGHANDGVDREANHMLSEQRALAVQHYFITAHGIAPARLLVAARGAAEPLDRENPGAAVNGRIELLGR